MKSNIIMNEFIFRLDYQRMSNIIDPFESARIEWKKLSVNQSWIGVFGDLYVQRFPTISRGTGASQAKAITTSLFDGDDSVHAYDATGVRQTILKRIMESEKRGHIRQWYMDAGLFAEKTHVLRAFKEEDIDYILRLSLLFPDDNPPRFTKEIRSLSDKLDPPMSKLMIRKEELFNYISPQIELFGVLRGLERLLFPLSKQDCIEVLELILDPEKADNILRKRFVEEGKKAYPLVGEGHFELKTKHNFVLKYIGEKNPEFFQRRTVLLWLYSFFMDIPETRDYLRDYGASVINEIDKWLDSNEKNTLEDLVWRAVNFIKFKNVFMGLIQKLRSEYASKAIFSNYSSAITHLITQRDSALQPFQTDNGFPIHIAIDRYTKENLLLEIGQALIDSVLSKLASEIPIPRGTGTSNFQGSIMMKRRLNMEREVAPPSLQSQLLESISKIYDYLLSNKGDKIEGLIREPHKILMPRGVKYFAEMKARVEAIKQEIGMDLTEELSDQLDNPQSLVRQFGPEAQRFTRNYYDEPDQIKHTDIYGIVLAFKSFELLFGDATVNIMRKKQIVESLMEDYYTPQIELLKKIKSKQDQIEELTAIATADQE